MVESIRLWVTGLLDSSPMIKSQVKTLTNLVVGATVSGKSSISGIAECLPGDALEKHKIKTVDRFLGNERVPVDVVEESLIALLCRGLQEYVVLATDWTQIGDFWVLTTGIVTQHRSIPVLWTPIPKGKLRKPTEAKKHIKRLRRLIPSHLIPIMLLDREFHDQKFLRQLERARYKYVVRSSCDVCIRRPGEKKFVQMKNIPMERERVYDFGVVDYVAENPVQVRVVMLHDKAQEEPWRLVTNLTDLPPDAIVRLYARRFEIEETFKDLKQLRDGYQLSDHPTKNAGRLYRLIMVLVLSYVALVLVGLWGESQGLERQFKANTAKKRTIAVWRLGRKLLKKAAATFHDFFAFVTQVCLHAEVLIWTA